MEHLHCYPLLACLMFSLNHVFVCATSNIFNKGPIPLIYKVWKSNKQLQKDSLEKRSDRTLVSDWAFLAQKWSKIAMRKKKFTFWSSSLTADGSRSRSAAESYCAYWVSRVSFRSPSAHNLLLFRSPFVPPPLPFRAPQKAKINK